VAVMAILETDPSITDEQSDLISDVLNGRLRRTHLHPPVPVSTSDKMPAKQCPKDYMSKKEAAIYVSMSSRSLDNYRAKGELPFHKVGEKVVFMRSDLDAFMASWRIDVAGA
jgi:excisionase family DNA binding protein